MKVGESSRGRWQGMKEYNVRLIVGRGRGREGEDNNQRKRV